jgi:hypothetical protein
MLGGEKVSAGAIVTIVQPLCQYGDIASGQRPPVVHGCQAALYLPIRGEACLLCSRGVFYAEQEAKLAGLKRIANTALYTCCQRAPQPCPRCPYLASCVRSSRYSATALSFPMSLHLCAHSRR